MGDEEILQALATLTSLVKDRMHNQDPGLSGMDRDPDNGPKAWSGISLTRGKDDRPTLSDKDYIIEKLAMGQGQEMPHDSQMDYARPM
jgi:hypothetical protein